MKDMTWKTLSSEYLIKRPWLTARRDKVQLPDGRILDEYYVLEYPTWGNVIAITKEGDMVLVRQYRHALGRTNFELVAGVLEKGEDPLVAAQRELLLGGRSREDCPPKLGCVGRLGSLCIQPRRSKAETSTRRFCTSIDGGSVVEIFLRNLE